MELYSGLLTIRVPSILKVKLYSNLWCILYNGRSKSLSPRIDLYEDKSQVGKITGKKTIYIEEAKWKKIDSEEPAFSFEVKHNKQYVFVTSSKSELTLWILVLCCASKELFDTKYTIGIEDLSKMETSYINEDGEEIVVTNNILYSSGSDLSRFVVLADQSEGCLQYGLKGPYKLNIEQAVVQLLQHNTDEMIASWSLQMLKKFGHSQHTFFLEAGTRSPTGAGKFTFHTTEGQRITELLHLEAGQVQTQSLAADNSQQTKAPIAKVRSFSQGSTVKSKPPPPPSKPKSLSVKNRGNEIDQLEHMEPQGVSEHQLPKKNPPAFGISVLPQPSQTINLNVSDIVSPTEGNEIGRRESYNGLDIAISNQVKNHKKQLMMKKSISIQSSELEEKKDRKKEEKELKKSERKKQKRRRKRRKDKKKRRKRTEKKRRRRKEN